jgi:hypothetical protein
MFWWQAQGFGAGPNTRNGNKENKLDYSTIDD